MGNEERSSPLDRDVAERTDDVPCWNPWDYKVVGILRSRYPDLSENELTICMWIFYTMWDLKTGNSAWHIELVARLLKNRIFENEKQIDDVIKNLVSNRVLEVTQEGWIFGGRVDSMKVLKFTQENLCRDLHSAG